MQRRHDLGAFADRRRNALDRTRTHVADREDALAAGFQLTAIAARLGTPQHEPLASNATPDPDSQFVFGSAPMNRKRWRIDRLTRVGNIWCARVSMIDGVGAATAYSIPLTPLTDSHGCARARKRVTTSGGVL